MGAIARPILEIATLTTPLLVIPSWLSPVTGSAGNVIPIEIFGRRPVRKPDFERAALRHDLVLDQPDGPHAVMIPLI
jgi:hypothetical protein